MDYPASFNSRLKEIHERFLQRTVLPRVSGRVKKIILRLHSPAFCQLYRPLPG